MAASTVQPGGAAFSIVPHSHKKTLAAAESLATPEERTAFRSDIVGRTGLDPAKEGIEVCADEGSVRFSPPHPTPCLHPPTRPIPRNVGEPWWRCKVIVFNPMCLHSASSNTRPEARYVVVTSFSHAHTAGYLQGETRKIRYLHDWRVPCSRPCLKAHRLNRMMDVVCAGTPTCTSTRTSLCSRC